jgi:flavin reductase (DIM6/NTAB) family NADH-FMN oxidoreductase RutF
MKQVSFREAMELWMKPERIVLVTSVSAEGKPHVITVGWKMRCGFQPPMFAIAIAKERRMHKYIMDSKEFVLAVPGASLAKEALKCGIPGEDDEDRFVSCDFSKKPGNFVRAPLVHKCIASFECKLVSQLDSGDHTIFVGEVLASWINEKPESNLILIGDDQGYELLDAEGPYRVGVVRS